MNEPHRIILSRSNQALLISLFLIGAFLITYGFCNFFKEVQLANIFETIENINRGQDVKQDEIQMGIERINKFNTSKPTLLSDLALLKLKLAEKSADRKEFKSILTEARQELQNSLYRAPANPTGWAQLGYIEFLLNGASRNSGNALYLSVITGPYLPNLLFSRLELLLKNYAFLSDEQKKIIDGQIKTAWKISPQQVVKIASAANTEEIVLKAVKKIN